MIGQLDWLHTIIGAFGFLLIINSILMITSYKYFSFLGKSFFIEPLTIKEKDKVRTYIEKNKNKDRIPISIICLGLAVIAILWSFGITKHIPIPSSFIFFVSVILSLVSRYLIWKEQKSY